MGEKLWKKFKEIIYKDVSRESESNDLSVLLRCMSLAEIVYLIIIKSF